MKPGVVVRVGAAVFVAGVSLAGPVPVAVADDGGLAAEVRSGAAGSEAGGSDGAAGSSRGGARAVERAGAAGLPAAEPTVEIASEPVRRSAVLSGGSTARAVAATGLEATGSQAAEPPGRAAERGSAVSPRRGAAVAWAEEVPDGVVVPGESPGPAEAVRGSEVTRGGVGLPAGLLPEGAAVPSDDSGPPAPVQESAAGVGRQTPAQWRSAGRDLLPATSVVVDPGLGRSGDDGPVAVPAEDSVDVSSGVGVVSAQPGAAVADLRPASAPVLSQSWGALGAAVERAIDTVGQWLSGLSANPVTDFLSGALWLVRRTVFPVGSGVGLWGSAACVATKDCSGQDLTGADFTGQDLTKVDFTNAVLRSVILRNADLTEADLSGAAITGARFTGATLVGTTLAGVSDADLISAIWADANLSGQDFSGRILLDANTGRGINLSGTDLTDAKFIGTTLGRARFVRADLTGADLRNSKLLGADFSRATLVDADLSGVVASAAPRQEQTFFTDANLTGADLIGARLARSVLFRANLTDADLTGADLAGAVLTGVTWKNTTCPDGSKTDTGCSGSAPAAGEVFGPLVAGVGRVLGGVAAGVDRVLGAASQWVSGFPGAVASVMVGALDVVRRGLRDFVVGLPGWSVSGTSVEVKNRTDQVLVLRQDPDGIRGGSQTGQQWVFLDPGQNATFSGYHSDDKAVDVLLSVNLAKKVGEDTVATDETRMVLVANNTWLVTPELRVEAVDPSSLQDGKNLNRAYLAYRASEFLWIDTWSLLSEGEDCFCDAVNSGGPADGPQVYVGRRDDSDDYKNFYVEIFSVGATPTGGGKDIYPVNRDARYYCNGKGEKRQGGGGWV